MKNQFVAFEIALILKELGFDEECFAFYNPTIQQFYGLVNEKTLHYPEFGGESDNWNKKDHLISAPLWQQVTAWFRDKYKISIEINLIDNCIDFYYEYSIVCSPNRQYYDGEMLDQAEILYNDLKFKSYEEAREAAIRKVLKILKNEEK